MGRIQVRRLGWQRDLPDVRDYAPGAPAIEAVLKHSTALTKASKKLPKSVDLRAWCSPVADQGDLGSCTAHAASGLIEYFEHVAFGRSLAASRLFIYKATRDLMGVKGDQGAQLRTTMQALAMFGAPPEAYWPYVVSKYDLEPSAYLYAMASNYKALKYYRHDPAGSSPNTVLPALKTALAGKLPMMFGTTVYESFPGLGGPNTGSGDIPYPTGRDAVSGGHAMVLVGYDDNHSTSGSTGTTTPPGAAQGAFLVRNSWGSSWGQGGYGWLPYAYVTQGLANDFWSLVQASFIDTALFN